MDPRLQQDRQMSCYACKGSNFDVVGDDECLQAVFTAGAICSGRIEHSKAAEEAQPFWGFAGAQEVADDLIVSS
jgi:hypothetical protein